MNPKFFANIIFIAQSLAFYILIQGLSFLIGRSNPMLMGIIILTSSMVIFFLSFGRAYLKDKKEKRKIQNAVLEMN